ncbi:MAG: site-specific integrase [Pseudomonadota bacterium]|nr:site-specific integrase [Pseudomonadota bacterium]
MAKVRQSNSGKWFVDYRVGATRFRPEFATRREAEQFIRDLRLRPLDQALGYAPLKSAGVNTLVDDYKQTVSINKSPGTQELEIDIFKEFLETFKGSRIIDVSQQQLELYQGKLRRRLAAETVNRHFTTLRHFFNRCVDWEYLHKSPCAKIKNLKNDKQKAKRILTDKEIELALKSCQPWLADVVLFGLKTAMRRKELISLCWSAIDLDARMIHIESSEDFHPKGYKPRSLPMTNELLIFLKQKKQLAFKHGVCKKTDKVFLNSIWHPIHPKQMTKEMNRVQHREGLEKFSPHLLRHTALTKMASQGISPAVIQRVAGHADIRTTQAYLHPGEKDLVRALESLVDQPKNAFN